MKTYYKGVTSIVAIFMTLILFSCQVEQIEPQETFSSESDQLMLKRGRVNYNVSLISGDGLSSTYLLITPTDCFATSNSKQDLIWFDDACKRFVTTSNQTVKLKPSSIRLKGVKNGYELIMNDSDGETYFGNWEDVGGLIILPLEDLPDPFIVDINHVFEMYKVMGKGKNAPPRHENRSPRPRRTPYRSQAP